MRTSKDEHGASLVEFAIVLPVLLVVVFGLVEFGRLVAVTTQVTTASREAARYGIATGPGTGSEPRYIDCVGIRDAARAKVRLLTLDDSEITVEYDRGPSTAVYAVCLPTGLEDLVGNSLDADDIDDQSRVVVTVSTTFTTPVPIISGFIDGRSVDSIDRRTIFKELS